MPFTAVVSAKLVAGAAMPPGGVTAVVTVVALVPRYTLYAVAPGSGCHATSTRELSAIAVGPAGPAAACASAGATAAATAATASASASRSFLGVRSRVKKRR